MVVQPPKGPKLRAKGAECRYLVPWGVNLVSLLNARVGNTRTKTIVQVPEGEDVEAVKEAAQHA